MFQASFWFACASAVAILFSIAVSQILLGASLIALFASRAPLRFPPFKLPLALLFAGTVLAVAMSGAPPLTGLPQLKKFFVFAMLLALASTLKTVSHAAGLLLAIIGAATLSSAWSVAQFAFKYFEARSRGEDFYLFYVGARTTGFMSHWMTFSGEVLMVFTAALAWLMFAKRYRKPVAAAALVMGLALLLNETRSVWVAAVPAVLYLLLRFNWKLAMLAPVAAALVLAIAPSTIQQRALSIVRPHGTTDSNQHRIVTWRTGVEMIRDSPWFGVGPELVDDRFEEHIPADIERPLPSGWYGHLHNNYLQYAAERGIPVLIILLWLLGKIAWDLARRTRHLPNEMGDARFLVEAALAAWIGVVVGGLFEYNLGNSEVLTLFLAMTALGYAACSAATSSATS